MDITKCEKLKNRLAKVPEPQWISAEEFFEGNDDEGSIGCNLPDHPGIALFHRTFSALQNRPDVEAIYVQISELDPGEDCWPFADTVFVAGSLPPEELRSIVRSLGPTEVGPAEGIPVEMASRYSGPIWSIWWD